MRPYQQLLRALFKNNNIIFNMTNWKVFSYPDTPIASHREKTRRQGHACSHAHAGHRKARILIHSLIFTLVSTLHLSLFSFDQCSLFLLVSPSRSCSSPFSSHHFHISPSFSFFFPISLITYTFPLLQARAASNRFSVHIYFGLHTYSCYPPPRHHALSSLPQVPKSELVPHIQFPP